MNYCFYLDWAGWPPELWAMWFQVAVGSIAAAATLWAVRVALRSSRIAVDAARQIHASEADERAKVRRSHALAVASAATEELWECATRVHEIQNYMSDFPEGPDLLRILIDKQIGVIAPVLEGSVMDLGMFSPDDAACFSLCTARIKQIRRYGEANANSEISPAFQDAMLRSIESVTERVVPLLEDGLERAHRISGIPITRPKPAHAGNLYIEDQPNP